MRDDLTRPAPSPARDPHRPVLTGLVVVGGVITLNAATLGMMLMFGPWETFSETAASRVHLGFQAILLACVAALNLLLPRLAGLRGSTGRVLPAWVLVLAAVATFADGGTRFVFTFVVPWLADAAPALLDEDGGGSLMAAMVSAWVLFTLALVCLGVTAYRRRVFPRPACVLLAVGGLAVPAIGPAAGVLLGPALVWAALARLRPGAVVDDVAPTGPTPAVALG